MNKFFEYERPSVTADVVLLRTINPDTSNRRNVNKILQVCLYKRADENETGKWSLPGGFVAIDKTIEEVAREKVEEKVGYGNVFLEQLYTFDSIHRDNRWRVISTAYIGIIKDGVLPLNTEDENVKWFDITEENLVCGNETVSYDELAFDHGAIIKKAIERLQGKIFYSDIGFEFLPDTFTMRELQNVFETIVGHQISNFRRTMDGRVEETEGIVLGKAYRPAKMFKKSKNSLA